MAKKITANYASKCGKCGGSISAGTPVMWERGAGVWHVACPARAERAPDSPRRASAGESAPSTSDAPFVVYEKWEPCKRAHLRDAKGESRRYAKVSSVAVREGAPEGTAAEPGAYVVVGQAGRYLSAEDADDFGDCGGAQWSMTLYLRRATPEEEQADANKRLAEGLPAVFAAFAGMLDRCKRDRARAEHKALAESEGYARWECWRWEDLYALAGGHEADGGNAWADVWVADPSGRDRYSWVKASKTPDGRPLLASHQYIYDWDQPYVVAAPADAIERAKLAVALCDLGSAVREMVRRAERRAA